jgi:hypothetical protein
MRFQRLDDEIQREKLFRRGVQFAQIANFVGHGGDFRVRVQRSGHFLQLAVDDVEPHVGHQGGVVVARTVKDGQFALPQAEGLSKLFVKLLKR